LISLTRELRGIEEVREAEKALLEKKRPRGRRRRSPEAETLADLVDLEEARLRAAGELTLEQQEQLKTDRMIAELGKIETERRKRKITDQLAFNRAERVELELVADIAELRRKAAEERRQEHDKRLQDLGAEADAARQARADELAFLAERRSLLEGLAVTPRERAQARLGGELEDIGAAGQAGLISPVEQEALENMAEARAAFDGMADSLNALGEAGLFAAESSNATLAGFGQLAATLQTHGAEIAGVVEEIAAAQAKGAAATVGAVSSAIAVGGKLATAFIKDEQAKAVISGLVETAAAAAAFAYQDYVGGAMHTVAAALYFAAAGTSGKKTSAQTGGGARTTRPVSATPPPDTRQVRTTVYNINAPAAVVGGTVSEAGVELERVIRSSEGTGFGSEFGAEAA
jgi:hypothetical protein